MARTYDLPTQDDVDVELDFPTKILFLRVGTERIALDRAHAGLLAKRLVSGLEQTDWR